MAVTSVKTGGAGDSTGDSGGVSGGVSVRLNRPILEHMCYIIYIALLLRSSTLGCHLTLSTKILMLYHNYGNMVKDNYLALTLGHHPRHHLLVGF
jgi:hypothetical protein